MTPDLSVERHASVRDQVTDRLREAIVNMQLAPGQLLIERELCAVTTASRASVREALRRLESEGLVVSEPGRGTRVARLSADEARHLYELRAILEGAVGRLFAERATEAELDALGSAVGEIEQLVDDPPSMLRAKARFYEVLLVGTGNPELRRVLDGLHHRVTLMRATSMNVPGRSAQSVAEMKAILEAARRHDVAETAQLCTAHVRAAEAAWLEGSLPD